MLDTIGHLRVSRENQSQPITAEKIVKDIVFHDDLQNIREDLHDMMLSLLMRSDDHTDAYKARIIGSYSVLYQALKEMESIKPQSIAS